MRYLSTLVVSATLVSACGSGGDANHIEPPPGFVYQQPSASTCDASAVIAGGLLCAIRPSRLDANSRDVYGSASPADLIFGFGYHAIAFPPTGTDIQGIYIHLTGSYGRPYNPVSDVFASASFLQEALSAGYITIQLAYDNRFSINFDECGGDPGKLSIDNCSGDARMEKIIGTDVSSVVDTPIEDSIEFRLLAIADYLQTAGFEFPFEITVGGAVNWPALRVGGHSQGATHALYLAKYFFAGHACLLAGGYDIADAVPTIPVENIADWLLDDSVTLDLDGIRAVVSVDDGSYDNFVRTYGELGLIRGVHFEEVSGAPYSDADGAPIGGHSAILNDPRYADLRTEACFADPG